MKNLKRILAILLAACMLFSVAGCSKESSTSSKETTAGNNETTAGNEETTADDSGNSATEITVNLHYLRDDGTYDGWNVWLWPDGGDGNAYQFGTEADDNGVVTTATFPAGTEKVGFIVRLNEWEKKDFDGDQFIELTGILAGSVDVYVVSGTEGYTMEQGDDCVTGLGVSKAEMADDYLTITVTVTQEWSDDNALTVKDSEGNDVAIASTTVDESNAKKLTIVLSEEADHFGGYKVVLNGTYEYDIEVPDYFSTEEFEAAYTYDGDDLGFTWTKESTTFKVWAPTASAVSVNLYESGTKGTDDLIKTVEMTKGDKGVWSVTVEGDLNKTYYTYSSTVAGVTNEACDPYAKTTGVNGNRAMVLDMASTNPEGWANDKNPNAGMDFTDAFIYELHVRDLSIDKSSGITNAGKYLGIAELGTKNAAGYATGLSHMVDLGITHLHLNPVYDYATVDESKLDTPQFNWGYDPKNYNVPEGSYSTDPYNGEVRVAEFKEMVQTLHENGISVVLDVVYNHTYTSDDYCFNLIVPDYFHRPGSNGSGCGNDVASERAMVRKYIVDSVVYWAKEYHVDGFRFDLVGLIDTQTIKDIRTALDEIDPSIILYGEGWSMSTITTKPNTPLATQSSVKNLPGFAMFNDTIRDAIKGSVFEKTAKGYVNGDLTKTGTIKNSIQGITSWSSKPSAMVNYACCHDNHTLWDEISMSNGDDSLELRLKQNLMSASIVYTSQGIPFILAGEEFLRSKPLDDGSGFDHNSYASPDSVNSMKWDTLGEEANQTAYNYYKGMIEFRKAHASLSLMDEAKSFYTFTSNLPDGVIAYELAATDGEVSDALFVVHNASAEAVTVNLPAGDWTICVQGDKAGTVSLGTATGTITVDSVTTTVLVKGALK